MSDDEIGVAEINFVSSRDAYGAWIEAEVVSNLEEEPSPEYKVYKYFKLTKNDRVLNNEVVKGYDVLFSVSSAWAAERKIKGGEVVLLHLVDDRWVDLDTEYLKQENGYYLSKATTPDFSYFAIAGKVSQEAEHGISLYTEEKVELVTSEGSV